MAGSGYQLLVESEEETFEGRIKYATTLHYAQALTCLKQHGQLSQEDSLSSRVPVEPINFVTDHGFNRHHAVLGSYSR